MSYNNADPESITTTLIYHTDTGKRQAFSQNPKQFPIPQGTDDSDSSIPITKIVRNARRLHTSPSLDSHGFTLARQKSAITRDQFIKSNVVGSDEEKLVKDVYYSEVAALLCGLTGCTVCRPFNHQIRSSDASVNDDSKNGTSKIQKPAGAVHSDYATRNALNLYDSMCPKDILGKGGKFVVINAWRNINPTSPILNNHLAMCDGTSVVAPDDFIPLDLYLPNGQLSETYRLDAARSDDHRWFYYPRMVSDEVLLFIQYSSDPRAMSRFTFHTAIHDPTFEAAKHPGIFRESIELRCICFFPDHPVNTIPRQISNPNCAVGAGVKKLVSMVSYLPHWDEGGRRWIRSIFYGEDDRAKTTEKLARHLAEEHIRQKSEVRNSAKDSSLTSTSSSSQNTNGITDEVFEKIIKQILQEGEFRRVLEMHLKPISCEERIPEAIQQITTAVRPDLVAIHWKDKSWAVSIMKSNSRDVSAGCRQIATALVKYSCENSTNNLNPKISENMKDQVVKGLVASKEFQDNCVNAFR